MIPHEDSLHLSVTYVFAYRWVVRFHTSFLAEFEFKVEFVRVVACMNETSKGVIET
jgi:hypothetical protein